MKKFSTYYIFLLYFSIFVFYQLNNFLIQIDASFLHSFTPAIILVLIGLVLLFLNGKKFIKFTIIKIPLYSLFMTLTFILILFETYISQINYIPAKELYTTNVYWFILGLAGFIFAFYLEKIFYLLNTYKLVALILSSLFLLILIVLIFKSSILIFLNRSLFLDVGGFQKLSDYIVLGIFIIVAKYFNYMKYIWPFIITGFVELFIFGSRSSIFFFLGSIFLLYIKNKKYATILMIVFLALMILSYYMNDIITFYQNDDRIMSMFSGNYMHDASLLEREKQFKLNSLFIRDNWFLGSIYSEYFVKGKGSYIHNYVSYLQNFGIIPFLIINLLMIKIIYFLYKEKDNTFEFRFIFLISSFAILSALFSRSYNSIWILMVFGMAESYIAMYKKI